MDNEDTDYGPQLWCKCGHDNGWHTNNGAGRCRCRTQTGRGRPMCKCKAFDLLAPPCAVSMGCLCAGHARGNHPNVACDTRETV